MDFMHRFPVKEKYLHLFILQFILNDSIIILFFLI